MAKRPTRLGSKTLARYIMSYLLVLLIPLCAFFLIYNSYFAKLYQDEVLERYENDLDSLANALTVRINWMHYIAGQLANQKTMKKDYIQEDYPAYIKIMNTLSSIVSPQDFFSTLAYSSADLPGTVFTNKGTYGTNYYKTYQVDGGRWVDLRTMLDTLEGEAWFIPAHVHNPSSPSGQDLEYILPIPGVPGDFALFTIPERSIRNLPKGYALKDMILVAGKEQLYPFKQEPSHLLGQVPQPFGASVRTRLKNGDYLFSRHIGGRNGVTSLSLAVVLPQGEVLSRVTRVQNIFMLIFIILICLGGSVVFTMAFVNWRPIRNLFRLAREAPGGIPGGLKDMEAVTYAIESMGEQYTKLEERARREKIILQLVYGRAVKPEAWEERLGQIGLSPRGGYRVVVLYLRGNPGERDPLGILLEQVGSSFDVAGMEYLRGSCYLALVGGEEGDGRLKELLLEVQEELLDENGVGPCIVVGGGCPAPQGLPQSFRQAMRLDGQMAEEGIHFLKGEAGGDFLFSYPKLDVQALHNALAEKNMEKADLITNMLLDTAKAHAGRPFIAISLCCDMINTYLMALRELNLPSMELADVYSIYSSFYNYTDIETLLEAARRVRSRVREAFQKLDGEGPGEKDSIGPIVSYIHENLGEPDFCIGKVAEQFGLSASNLSHRFKAQTGINISDYINEKKMAYAKSLLRDSQLTVAQIGLRLGYTQSSNFIRKFKAFTGMTPNEYRAGGKSLGDL